jgi:4-amino-4-deoxy-L-arabinose transferase-like glycosyltransferase
MVASPPPDPSPFWRRHAALFLVLALHGALGAAVDTVLSPYPDYIDHWMQSRVIEIAYYQHPPMIAWLIRGLTTVFGESEAGLEAGALLTNLGVLAAAYALAYTLYGRLGALFALLMLEATFYFFAGAPMLQQEQPLMLAWLGALACLLAYRRTGQGGWLIAMGVFGGLGALSKYTMVVFYLGVLAWALLVKERRRELLNPWQYAGGLLALAIFSPVLVWNAQRDWVSIRLQLEKGMSRPGVFFGKHLLEFTLGALLLFSAVLTVWGAWRLWRRWRAQGLRDDDFTLVATVGAVAIGFFWLAMIRGSFPDPKWANVGFLCF